MTCPTVSREGVGRITAAGASAEPRRRPALRPLTLAVLTTVLDVLGLVLVLAALGVLAVLVPAVGLLLVAAAVALGLSWTIERLR